MGGSVTAGSPACRECFDHWVARYETCPLGRLSVPFLEGPWRLLSRGAGPRPASETNAAPGRRSGCASLRGLVAPPRGGGPALDFCATFENRACGGPSGASPSVPGRPCCRPFAGRLCGLSENGWRVSPLASPLRLCPLTCSGVCLCRRPWGSAKTIFPRCWWPLPSVLLSQGRRVLPRTVSTRPATLLWRPGQASPPAQLAKPENRAPLSPPVAGHGPWIGHPSAMPVRRPPPKSWAGAGRRPGIWSGPPSPRGSITTFNGTHWRRVRRFPEARARRGRWVIPLWETGPQGPNRRNPWDPSDRRGPSTRR